MRKTLAIVVFLLVVAPLAASDPVDAAGPEYLVESFETAPSSWLADWFDSDVGSRNRVSSIGDGVEGDGINVSVPAGSHFGTAAQYRFGDEGLSDPDELYYRYFIRLPEGFKNYGTGKIPGPAGLYSASGRNQIKPTDANPGWSARMQFSPSTLPAASNTTAIGFYVYHRDQARSAGDSFVWDEATALLTHDTWHCVEGHVSMNTPGAQDGLLEGWVDEQLAFYKDDFRFLGSQDGALGVQSFWFDTYYGGGDPAPGALNFQFDELVLSANRVGCGNVDTSRFVDTGDNVHEANIERLAHAGITRGCNPPSNDRFCPNAGVTRGQMAAFLTRALALPSAAVTDRFLDDDDSVFEDSIDRLASSAITLGCNPPTNDRFCPDQSVSRGQMAAFLTRAIDFDPPSMVDVFVDDNDSVFESVIDWLASEGVTRGCNPPTNDRFCPDDAVTRAQMATFLTRALDLPAPPVEPYAGPFQPIVPPGFDAAVPLGWSIQAVIDSQPEGAAIYIEPGVHAYQALIPKKNQSLIGPQAVLDGMGTLKLGISGSAPGVSISGLEIRNFSRGIYVSASGWTIDDVYVHDDDFGLEATGDDLTVTASTFKFHQHDAIRVTGAANFTVADSIIESANLVAISTYSAGIKLNGTTGAVVDNNTVTGIYGYGVWFTDGATGTVVTDNLITDSARAGVSHDYAYGSTIDGNTLTGNGRAVLAARWEGAGILVLGPDATVSNNTVGGNRAGIVFFTHSSGLDGPSGLYIPTNAFVTDNLVVESGSVGLFASSYPQVFSSAVFDRNSYVYSVDDKQFVWEGRSTNWSGWQSHGQDANGSFSN